MPTCVVDWSAAGADVVHVFDPQELVELFKLPVGTHPFIHSVTVFAPSSGNMFVWNDVQGFYSRKKGKEGELTDANTFQQIREKALSLVNDGFQRTGEKDLLFFLSTTGGVGFAQTTTQLTGWNITQNIVMVKDEDGDEYIVTFHYDIVEGELNWGYLHSNHRFRKIEFERTAGKEFFKPDGKDVKRKVGVQ